MVSIKENKMKNYMLKYLNTALLLIGFSVFLSSCAKDDYYSDGGKANGNFDGDIIQYLDSKPKDFDTIAQIIRIAGLEETFKTEKLTFFAPNDSYIKAFIKRLNPDLHARYIDTVKVLSDIKPEIWKKYLLRYVFKGENKLADYPQIDYDLLTTFPGQNYFSYNGNVFNIGVVYNSVNGVKYLGSRELQLNFIPDISKPKDNWIKAYISSSNIKPNNGVVHALAYTGDAFGFEYINIYQDIVLAQ